jgi:hypothetical protein
MVEKCKPLISRWIHEGVWIPKKLVELGILIFNGFGVKCGLFWLSRRRLSPGASSESVATWEILAAACPCGAGGSSPLPTRGICPHLSRPNPCHASVFYTLNLLKMQESCEGVVFAIWPFPCYISMATAWHLATTTAKPDPFSCSREPPCSPS